MFTHGPETTPTGPEHGRPVRLAVAAATVAVALLQCGCLEQFEPYWRVESYRIMGMKSDPATLKPGDFATISVLDYVPEGTDVEYEWSWCPVEPSAQDRYRCPLRELGSRTGDAGMDADGGMGADTGTGGLDPSFFDLGDGETASFVYPGSREQVLELCRQIQEAIAGASQQSQLGGSLSTRDCSRGFEVAIRLEAETDAGTTEIAKKNIVLWTGNKWVNENPGHDGISIRVSKPSDIPKARSELDWVPPRDRRRDRQWYSLPEDRPTPILASMPFDIRADVPPESVQDYRAPPPEGSDKEKGPMRKETLTFQWFVTEGTIAQSQRIHIPGNSEYDVVRGTALNLPELPAPSCADGPSDSPGSDAPRTECDVSVWSVVRDDRKGQNWSGHRLRVVGVATNGE